MGVVFLFTAITVPLGISSMDLAGWGVWVFCQQASATICLFESFTQSAFMRLLIQVKENQSSEAYEKLIWMGLLSFCSQGVLILKSIWGWQLHSPVFSRILKTLPPRVSF